MEPNKKMAAMLAAVIGLGVMGFGAVSTSAQAPVPPGIAAGRGHHERHPRLRVALRALMRARMALSHGARDFSGHRAQALELTNQAIAQTQQALQDDMH